MSGQDVDASLALRQPAKQSTVSYNVKDAILYAVSLGVDDLRYNYELSKDFAVFPTMPVVWNSSPHDVTLFGARQLKKDGSEEKTGIPKYNPNLILHGEQYLELLAPLPKKGGDFDVSSKLVGVHSKGKNALLETQSLISAAGKPVAKIVMGIIVREMGGFASQGVTYSVSVEKPKRAPDAVVEIQTTPQQAMMYRLNGDYNPLHADPAVAKAVGFPLPILHGLCTFGVAARAIVKTYGADSDLKAIKVRFASPVFPGEALVTEMWREGDRVVFETHVNRKEKRVTVLASAYASLVARAPVSRL